MGSLVTFTGQSGTGKTTIVHSLCKKYPETFEEAVSTTTRQPRPGEVEGVHYHYVSRERFLQLQSMGEFLETVEYVGTLYGVQRSHVDAVVNAGLTTLLIVEPQGAQQIRERYKGRLVQIYLLPPDEDILEARMLAQGRSKEDVARRLAHDRTYFSENSYLWDHKIPNGTIEQVCDMILTLLGGVDVSTPESGDAVCNSPSLRLTTNSSSSKPFC